ncbi:hypothetical protein D3C85_1094950 [compost metagenome]
MMNKIEGRRERFQKWVLATKHPVLGFLDGHWLARGDDREGYASEYVQGLWVAFKEFAAPEAPRQEPVAFLCKSEGAKWLQYHEKVGDPWKPGEVELTPLYAAPLSPDHSGGGDGMVLTDDQILEAMREHIYHADGGYVFDTAKDDVIAAGRALLDKVKELNQ